jgi:hypothetical protein
MRVRGFWPFIGDRQMPLPIPWPAWYRPDDKEGDDDLGEGGRVHSDDDLIGTLLSSGVIPGGSSQQPSHHNNNPTSRATLTLHNPFANPIELDALVRSFPEQASWKATVIEGETWEGTADENIKKWRGIVGA